MWRKILAVGRAEYLQAVRSKAFLIGILALPIMMGGSIAAQVLLRGQVELTPRRCAVVDPTGELWPVLEAAAAERNSEGIWETDEESGERSQKRPEFKLELHVPTPGEEAELALSDRVRAGELDGFLLLGERVLHPGAEMGERPAAYHTNQPTFEELPRFLEGVVNGEARRVRYEAAALDSDVVDRLSRRVEVGTWGLASRSSTTGEVTSGVRESGLRSTVIPLAAMFLLFMLVMTSAPALMNQVLEEKMLRISEVLVSAVSPFQLMMGKLLGSVLVCTTLGSLYLGTVAWATHHFDVAHYVPLSLYAWFFALMVLALLMYGSMMSALGSACSELRDAQSMMMPAMIVIMIPLFVWTAVIEAPNGTLATGMSFLPTATPMILLLRIAAPPGPPLWEVVAATGVCLVATVLFVLAGAKVFRIGVLSQGQTPSLRAVIGWVFSKG